MVDKVPNSLLTIVVLSGLHLKVTLIQYYTNSIDTYGIV